MVVVLFCFGFLFGFVCIFFFLLSINDTFTSCFYLGKLLRSDGS